MYPKERGSVEKREGCRVQQLCGIASDLSLVTSSNSWWKMDGAEEASLELEAVKGLAASTVNVYRNRDGKNLSWIRCVQLPGPPSLLSLLKKARECV